MRKRLLKTLWTIAVPSLLLLATFAVFFFAKGYRFDFKDGEIERTGVISIKTAPRKASVYIDDVLVGTTPRAFSSIPTGTHTIKVVRDGYFEWSTSVTLEAEQLIPFEISLVLNEPTHTTLFPNFIDTEFNTTVLSFSSNEENTKAVFSALSIPVPPEEGSGEPAPAPVNPEESPVATLQLWSYQLTRRFWETEAQPTLFAELTGEFLGVNIADPSTYSTNLLVSPNGDHVLFSIQQTSTESATQYFLLNTESTNDSPIALGMLEVTEKIRWSHDSQHLLFVRANELRSLNISTLAQTILTETSEETPASWTTNDSGTVIMLKKTATETALQTILPTGENLTTLATYRSTGTENTETTPEDTVPADEDEALTETSDDEVSQLLLDTTDIIVTPDSSNLILITPEAISLYSISTNSLDIYPAVEPEFVAFSPELTSLLYIDNDSLINELWFNPEERDPLHPYGPRTLIDVGEELTIKTLTWHPSAHMVLFSASTQTDTDDGSLKLFALDTESQQTYQISELVSTAFAPEGSEKTILAFCEEGSLCTITIQE